MSLNWAEIDAVLAETPLCGAFVQQITQPTYHDLLLECFNADSSPSRFTLRICTKPQEVRLHMSTQSPPRTIKVQRFAEFLRARIRGGRIQAAAQVGQDRIVRLEIDRSEEVSLLFCRLWSNAANVVVTDADSLILDAMFRRPKRGEITGRIFALPPPRTPAAPDSEQFRVRDYPAQGGSFSQWIERHYAARLNDADHTTLVRSCLRALLEAELRTAKKLESAQTAVRDADQAAVYEQTGRLLHANFAAIDSRAENVTLPDPQTGTPVSIALRPGVPPAQQVAAYFDRARNARQTAAAAAATVPDLTAELAAIRRDYDEVVALQGAENAGNLAENAGEIAENAGEIAENAGEIAENAGNLAENAGNLAETAGEIAENAGAGTLGAERGGTDRLAAIAERLGIGAGGNPRAPAPVAQRPATRVPVGLQFQYQGFKILVGRTAAENDALLRRHVRGNDTWVHVRDFSGAYVFVKTVPGKTIPLDVLLAAANLAVYYSKARANGSADLYYTQVKYLRRAKNGPKGLVLPTQERNLHIMLDLDRVRRVQSGDSGGDSPADEP